MSILNIVQLVDYSWILHSDIPWALEIYPTFALGEEGS